MVGINIISPVVQMIQEIMAKEKKLEKFKTYMPNPISNAPAPINKILLYALKKLINGAWNKTIINVSKTNKMLTELIPSLEKWLQYT